MKFLDFGFAGHGHVRKGCFKERSLLPVSAVCVVANGIRETLASVLQAGVEVRVFAPVIPDARAWDLLLDGAILLRARGNAGEAAIIVRPEDARALVCATFGEITSEASGLSTIEREVLQRLLKRLSGTLASVCGAQVETMVNLPQRRGRANGIAYATYFEISIERPVVASLGVALVRDPSPEPQGAIAIEHLHEVRLPLRVSLSGGMISAARACALKAGDVLPLDDRMVSALVAGSREIARGQCGASEDRYAFSIHELAA